MFICLTFSLHVFSSHTHMMSGVIGRTFGLAFIFGNIWGFGLDYVLLALALYQYTQLCLHLLCMVDRGLDSCGNRFPLLSDMNDGYEVDK